MIGDPETGKSLLAQAVRDAAPFGKSVMLTGSKSTIPGLTVAAGPGGQVLEGPLLLLDGDEETFGVVIIDEAQRLDQDKIDELKAPLEDGIYKKSTGTTGIVGGTSRTSILLVCNWATETGSFGGLPASLPRFLRDAAFLTRLDILIFTFRRGDEEVEKILKFKLEPVTTSITLQDFAEYIKKSRQHSVTVRSSIVDAWVEYSRELRDQYNALFRMELDGVRLAENLLRLSIALAKLARIPEVTKRVVEYAFRLLMQQLERLERLRMESRIPAGQTVIANTIIETLADRGGEMSKEELVETVIKKLERDYVVYRDDVEKVLEKLVHAGRIMKPEIDKVKLVY